MLWAIVGVTPGGTYGMLKRKWSKCVFGHELCDLLVLDEASQMNLPEAVMAALPMKADAPLIVVGDHRQMPPIVKHDWDRETRRTFRQYQVYESLFDTLRAQNPPIIRFADLITSPPPLLSVASKSVHSCRPSDPVGAAARVMHDNSFSQLPVQDSEKLVGLLTGETIARWLAVRLGGGDGILEEEPVGKVLEHQEAVGYILVGKAATVFDGLKEFDHSLHSGTSLQAIIVTANGKASETPLGIVTPSDIPGLVRAAEP
jgi:predicted transcriptional regulator